MTTYNGLITLARFQQMTAWQKGYFSQLQGHLPGSELKEHCNNPYSAGSIRYELFKNGQHSGVTELQSRE